jgi:hypothetical protein
MMMEKKMSCFTTLESYEEMKTLHELSQELRKDKNQQRKFV